MSDDPKKDDEATALPPPPVVGRQYPGQQFYATTTPEAEAKRVELDKQYAKDGAISFDAYLAHKKIRNPVMRASMEAYTTVRNATIEDWDKIFANH